MAAFCLPPGRDHEHVAKGAGQSRDEPDTRGGTRVAAGRSERGAAAPAEGGAVKPETMMAAALDPGSRCELTLGRRMLHATTPA